MLFSAVKLYFHHHFQRMPGYHAKESRSVSHQYTMLVAWLLVYRHDVHILEQSSWSKFVWSRFKTWKKALHSSPHFVSVKLLAAWRPWLSPHWAGSLSWWITSWNSVSAILAQGSEISLGIEHVIFIFTQIAQVHVPQPRLAQES